MVAHETLDSMKHHLYVCRDDSVQLQRHLLFRDYLRKDTESRKQYEAIKSAAAIQAHQDKTAYAEIKEEMARSFIDNIIQKAANGRGI